MSSLRQNLGQWFNQDENKQFAAADCSEKTLIEGHKKALKDLKANKDSMDIKYYRGIWKAFLRGAFKVKSHTAKVTQQKALSDINLEIWTPGQEKIDKKLFETYKTETGIDIIMSNKGGATKATTTIIIGEPGAGKTTLCAHMQYKFQKNYKNLKVACVQSEMKRFDIAYEFNENSMPWMAELKYLILKDYGYENVKNTLIKIFTSGYDIIFLDSIENVAQKLAVYADMTVKEAGNFMLELFDHANDGVNNFNEKGEKVQTAIFAIQQVTKGGEFKGDNALKHETTAMMEVRKDERGNRYVTHTKHRRCGKHVDKRLFFTLDKKNNNEVVYDVALFTEAETQLDFAKGEKERMTEATKGFYQTFALKSEQSKLDIKKLAEEGAAAADKKSVKADGVTAADNNSTAVQA